MSHKFRSYKTNTLNISTPFYNSENISKLINSIMISGKKNIAETIVYDSFLLIKKETGQDPSMIFLYALENITPLVHTTSIRIAGSNYQVPVEISPKKQIMYALKWLVESARNRKENTMSVRLSKEILDAYRNTGKAVEKKQTIHKMAEANRAYAHYRW